MRFMASTQKKKFEEEQVTPIANFLITVEERLSSRKKNLGERRDVGKHKIATDGWMTCRIGSLLKVCQ